MKSRQSVQGYEGGLPPALADLVRLLRIEIARGLPTARSTVWHGHPVWFDGENPVVGYSAHGSTVTLLFWNGQRFGEPGLVPFGKHRAAAKEFRSVAEVDRAELRRWLDKARTNVFDSVSFFKDLRDRAKRRERASS